jgi:hypothetical protein
MVQVAPDAKPRLRVISGDGEQIHAVTSTAPNGTPVALVALPGQAGRGPRLLAAADLSPRWNPGVDPDGDGPDAA